MESSLFESEDGFHFESDLHLPEPSPPFASVPTAHMYTGSALDAKPPGASEKKETKKRKRAKLDPEIAAHFKKLSDEYAQLDLDAKSYHDPASEPLPPLPAYHSSFAKATKMAQNIVRGVHETVVAGGDEDEEARHMKDCLESSVSPTNPGPRVVCLYGNCGAGKSFFTNATLGVEGASLKTGDGGAGTLVPIEIVNATKSQKAPFVGLVFPYSPSTCDDNVTSMWGDYYDARVNPKREPSNHDPGKPVLKAFLAMFRDKEEFKNEDAAVRFLGRASSADDPDILSKLLLWTREIVAELGKLGNAIVLCHHTAMDLNKALEPYTQQVDYPEISGTSLVCCVYPLIRVVRKYFSNPVLASGIVVVDLPGISDTNRHRVQLAKAYFRSCHHAIVVHPIDRAEDDKDLESHILDVFNRKRSGSVAVVLTHSDDIEQEANSRIKYSPKQQAHLRSLDEHEAEVDEELKSANKLIRTSSSSQPLQESVRKLGLYQLHKAHIKRLRTDILVKARNEKVKPSLKDWYRRATNDPQELPVFPVSSKYYMSHMKRSTPSNLIPLSEPMTGIAEVRSYLFALAAKNDKVDALQLYYVKIKSLLNSMDLSCTGFKPMLKAEHLFKIVARTRKGIESKCKDARLRLYKRYIVPILIIFSTSEAELLQKAKEFCEGLSSYSSGGHYSFLKKNGRHMTPACGKGDWNASLSKYVRDVVHKRIDLLLFEGCHAFKHDSIKEMSILIDDTEKEMRENLEFTQATSFKPFFDGLGDHKKPMAGAIDVAKKYLCTEVTNMNTDALNDGPSSPFTTRMKEIYKACRELEAKTNKKAARCAYFQAAVCDPKKGPYAAIKAHVEAKFTSMMDEAERIMVSKCQKILDDVLRDFNRVCPSSEDNGAKALKRREKLGKKVQEAREAMKGPLQETLLECGIVVD